MWNPFSNTQPDVAPPVVAPPPINANDATANDATANDATAVVAPAVVASDASASINANDAPNAPNERDLTEDEKTDMFKLFEQIPAALDARQFITVNRFTKFRNPDDKACFLFHGVGTGKTFTSLTITLSHLTDNNVWSINDPNQNANKKPLKVLVMCPQGLFISAFSDDCKKLKIYTYNQNNYVKKSMDNIDYNFETFQACMKKDDNNYYKLLFTGFNYLELFQKEKSLDMITDQYDVLICDEAHKFITEKLLPLSKFGYDINYNKGGETIAVPTNTTPTLNEFPELCAIKDIRFLNFIKNKVIKQSIFLTGTPIQKSPEDIISILTFLNIKEINISNNAKLCKDVMKEAPNDPMFYFKRFESKYKPMNNSVINGFLANTYILSQTLSGKTISNLAEFLEKKDPSLLPLETERKTNWIDYFLGLGFGLAKNTLPVENISDIIINATMQGVPEFIKNPLKKQITASIINILQNNNKISPNEILKQLQNINVTNVQEQREEQTGITTEINTEISQINNLFTNLQENLKKLRSNNSDNSIPQIAEDVTKTGTIFKKIGDSLISAKNTISQNIPKPNNSELTQTLNTILNQEIETLTQGGEQIKESANSLITYAKNLLDSKTDLEKSKILNVISEIYGGLLSNINNNTNFNNVTFTNNLENFKNLFKDVIPAKKEADTQEINLVQEKPDVKAQQAQSDVDTQETNVVPIPIQEKPVVKAKNLTILAPETVPTKTVETVETVETGSKTPTYNELSASQVQPQKPVNNVLKQQYPPPPVRPILRSRPVNGGDATNIKQNNGNEELTIYINNLPEQSLNLKEVMQNIMLSYESSTLINPESVIDAIIKDSGVSKESIESMLDLLYKCINGIVPYEESKQILEKENVRQMLEPLLGLNYNFLKNPVSEENMMGGKKHKKTRKGIKSKNQKTKKSKYFGGLNGQLELENSNVNFEQQIVILNKNMENQILVKEIPVLLNLYLHNFELTLPLQIEYFLEKTLESFYSNKISLESIEIINYSQTLFIQYFSSKIYNLGYNRVEELQDEKQTGGDLSKFDVINTAFKTTSQDTYDMIINIITGGGNLNVSDIFRNSLSKLITILPTIVKGTGAVLGSEYLNSGLDSSTLTGTIGKTVVYSAAAYLASPQFRSLVCWIAQINCSIVEFVISTIISNYNLDGIVDNIMPFISIYNYDYIKTAIDTKEFYKNLIVDPAFNLSKIVNTNGTTNAFPSKFVENIYYPFTLTQINKMNNSLNQSIDIDIKKSFSVPTTNLADEKNAQLSYDINNRLNNLSCGIDIDSITPTKKNDLQTEYKTYYDNTLIKLQDKKVNQLKGTYVNLHDATVKPVKPVKPNIPVKEEYRPINIAENFIGINVVSNKNTTGELKKDDYFNSLNKNIQKNNENIENNIKFLQNKPYETVPYNGEQSKFENALELLKIIRTGSIFQGVPEKESQFVYHPHYVLCRNNDDYDVEYYLPVVYPTSDDIMYGFCNFLTEKGYKYVWANKDYKDEDPRFLNKQMDFGIKFTFPIAPFDTPTDNTNPICIILSPNHKEGFSFTFNPSLISLGLSDTAGDEEQIYGRVLRKYGVEGYNGKYDKKIYQYFSGGNRNTTTLPLLTSLYSLDNKTIFRGMYDSIGYEKTTRTYLSYLSTYFRSTSLPLLDNIYLSVCMGFDNTIFNNWISTESTKKALWTKEIGNPSIINMTPEKQKASLNEFIEKNFSVLELADELQLKLLYSIKLVNLNFFQKIAKKENSEVALTFSTYLLGDLNRFIDDEDFVPLDLKFMRESKKNPFYCINNLVDPVSEANIYIKNAEGDEILNITSAIVCYNNNNKDPTVNNVAPTAAPTVAPTVAPTAAPTVAPTVAPVVAPVVAPTVAPVVAPTVAPVLEEEDHQDFFSVFQNNPLYSHLDDDEDEKKKEEIKNEYNEMQKSKEPQKQIQQQKKQIQQQKQEQENEKMQLGKIDGGYKKKISITRKKHIYKKNKKTKGSYKKKGFITRKKHSNKKNNKTIKYK
jgi:hypothetical protein